MAEYFELSKDFQGFIEVDGEKVFVIQTRTNFSIEIDVPYIKGVSKGRALRRGVYDYKLHYSHDHDDPWFSGFLAINADGKLHWYRPISKYEMKDGSDLWTEFVKAVREQKYFVDPSRGAWLKGFSERVRRTPTEIVKGYEEGNDTYWLGKVFNNGRRSAEEKASLRAFLPASLMDYYDRIEWQDRAMAKACEREGSAKFTFGT